MNKPKCKRCHFWRRVRKTVAIMALIGWAFGTAIGIGWVIGEKFGVGGVVAWVFLLILCAIGIGVYEDVTCE